jgi:hypothetical protein
MGSEMNMPPPGIPDAPQDGAEPPPKPAEHRSEALEAELAMLEGLTPDPPRSPPSIQGDTVAP